MAITATELADTIKELADLLRESRNLLNETILAQAERSAGLEAMFAKMAAERAEAEAKREAEKAEAEAEHRRVQRNLEKQMGHLGISHGALVEAMFVNLHKKFNKLGFHFPEKTDGGYTYSDSDDRTIAQVDRLYQNGSSVMAVEVKAKLKRDDVDGHIERLGKISKYLKNKGDKRKVLGAVAGGIVSGNLLAYAHDKGLYVLVQNGESISIAPPPENFAPTEW